MLARVLSYGQSGIGAELKYVLAMLVQLMGTGATTPMTSKTLAQFLNMPEKRAKNALEGLIKLGVLRASVNKPLSGRLKAYALTERFIEELNGSCSGLLCDELLDAVKCCLVGQRIDPSVHLHDAGTMTRMDAFRARRRSSEISKINRLLLAVLIVHSDRLGVVREVSIPDLRDLCGFSSNDQVSHRLHKLEAQGFIRAFVPGSSSSILCRKQKSVFVLDFTSDMFLGGGCELGAVIYTVTPLHDHMATGTRVEAAVARYKTSRAYQVESGHLYRCRLLRNQSHSFFVLLQELFNKYVAAVMSLCWEELEPRPAAFRRDLPFLRRLIVQDFRQTLEGQSESHDKIVSLNALNEWIYDQVYTIAIKLRASLRALKHIDFSEADFALITRDFPQGYVTICILFRSRLGRAITDVYLLDDNGRDFDVVQKYSHERDLSLDDRICYGLASSSRLSPNP